MGEDVELPHAQQILRRAVQLDRSAAPVYGMSAEALEAAAAELGVGPGAVAMALAESLAGAGPSRRPLWERLIGPRRITVVRPCEVSAPVATQVAVDWLERGHLLRVSPEAPGILVARRRTDAVATAGRAVRSLNGSGGLSKVREVRGAVGCVADGTAAVCVQADLTDRRHGAVARGSGVGTVVLAGVGVGSVVVTPLLVLAAPLAFASGLVVARRSHKDTVQKVRRSLEDTTNAVALGTRPPSVFANLARSWRRSGVKHR